MSIFELWYDFVSTELLGYESLTSLTAADIAFLNFASLFLALAGVVITVALIWNIIRFIFFTIAGLGRG